MYSGGLNLSYLNGSNSLNQFNPATAVKVSTNKVNNTVNTFEKTFEKAVEKKLSTPVKKQKLNNEKTNPLNEISQETSMKRPELKETHAVDETPVEEVQVTEEVENVLNEVKEAMNETDLKKVKELLETLSDKWDIELPVEEIMGMMEAESMVPLNDLLEFMNFMFDGDMEMAGTEMIEKMELELETLVNEMINTIQESENLSDEQMTSFESQLTSLLSEMEQVKPEVFKDVIKQVEAKTEQMVEVKEDTSAKGILEKLGMDTQTTDEAKNETPFEASIKSIKAKAKAENAEESSEKGLKLGHTDKPTGQVLKAQVDETGMKPIEIFKDQNTNITSVKVAQTSTVTPKNIFDQVLQATNKMNFNVTENGSEMLVKLKPQELGQVELKVSIEKGVLMAEMTVENETVKAALESNMADLKSALSQKGYDVEGLNVSVGHQDKNQSDDQYQGSQSRRVRPVGGLEEEFDTHMEITDTGDNQINYLG